MEEEELEVPGPPPRPASRIGHGWRRRPGAYAILIRDGWLLLTHQQAPVPEFQPRRALPPFEVERAPVSNLAEPFAFSGLMPVHVVLKAS